MTLTVQASEPAQLALLAFSESQTTALNQQDVTVGLPEQWRELVFPKIGRHSRYLTVFKDGRAAVQAEADHSASGLVREIRYSLQDYPYLQWSWKISGVYKKGDLKVKSGDDYPARVYITFDTSSVKTGWWEEMQLKAYEMIYGARPPLATLSYIWANKAAVGTLADNPYTSRVKMLVVNSGFSATLSGEQSAQGGWVFQTRNLREDFIQAFGYEPPPVAAIAIMTDADNTGEQTTSWYGPITALSQVPEGSTQAP